MIYITAIGYLMIYSCFTIASDYDYESNNDSYRESMNLLFAGSFLSMVFWVSSKKFIIIVYRGLAQTYFCMHASLCEAGCLSAFGGCLYIARLITAL